MALSAVGQTSPATTTDVQEKFYRSATDVLTAAQLDSSSATVTQATEQLLAFKDSDVKFNLLDLMEILRNRRHEGWVLAAYPDPKTGDPLIGAGFSLDLPAREHPQNDQLNPHPFLEPSSAELWQAAGLDSKRLQAILDRFDDRLAAWGRKRFRLRIKTLAPQITEDEATALLRVYAIQAIYNAKGYCRDFDQLTPSQQMALSQLVYQMGVNLQEFSQFLDLLNNYPEMSNTGASLISRNAGATNADYWKTVQQSLIQSQWARLYRGRAVSVIAMLDPQYVEEPQISEQHVCAMLRPANVRRRTGRSAASYQLASCTGRPSKRHSRSTAHRSNFRLQQNRGN